MGNTVISKPKTAFVHSLYYVMDVKKWHKTVITYKCYIHLVALNKRHLQW